MQASNLRRAGLLSGDASTSSLRAASTGAQTPNNGAKTPNGGVDLKSVQVQFAQTNSATIQTMFHQSKLNANNTSTLSLGALSNISPAHSHRTGKSNGGAVTPHMTTRSLGANSSLPPRSAGPSGGKVVSVSYVPSVGVATGVGGAGVATSTAMQWTHTSSPLPHKRLLQPSPPVQARFISSPLVGAGVGAPPPRVASVAAVQAAVESDTGVEADAGEPSTLSMSAASNKSCFKYKPY